MTQVLAFGSRSGNVQIPASKSQAHRLLICAALGEKRVTLACDGLSKDIVATMNCLNAMGASIREVQPGLLEVQPITKVPATLCHLHCGESGSTLRFLLPVVGALGLNAVFHREGRLPERPLEPLWSELLHHGMTLRNDGAELYCEGQLTAGPFSISGDVSSQFISGLLMALPHLRENSTLDVTGKLESAAYITMTEDALRMGGITFEKTENHYRIAGNQKSNLPDKLRVEGDFSNAAFFLCIGALSRKGVLVDGLNLATSQGDRAVLDCLKAYGAEVTLGETAATVRGEHLRGITIDAAPIPDLIPVLSVVAAVAEGDTHIINAGRLRIKESDRLQTTTQLLRALGAEVEELPEGLIIHGVPCLRGGTVDACGDHRIAMSAAVASCVCTELVTVQGSECVQKSYPDFWNHFEQLKGEGI